MTSIALFLKELMGHRRCSANRLATDLGVTHASVSRWLCGKDNPSTQSCQRLAECSGWPVEKILSLAGHLPEIRRGAPAEWPEFGEYARLKYPELDEDEVVMIEGLIERRRERARSR